MLVTIAFWHFEVDESLRLALWPEIGGLSVTGDDGAALVAHPLAPVLHEATVEVTPGRYHAHVLRGDVVVAQGSVTVTGGAGPFLVGGGVWVAGFAAAALSQLQARSLSAESPAPLFDAPLGPLVQGDSYLAAHGRALEFAREDFPDLGPTATATFRLLRRGGDETLFETPAEVVSSQEVKRVRVDLTSSQTRGLAPGKYYFDVVVDLDLDTRVTFVGPLATLRVVSLSAAR